MRGLLFAAFAALGVTGSLPAKLYTHAGHLVTVESGRRLNLRCLGNGQPTVMLESGFGDTSMTWRQVQGQIATFTKVCSYDRAGLGFSDPARRPSTALNTADDLHRLVAAGGIQQPFVLVGHAAGGLYATVYAGLYGSDVAAMVLINPAFAEHDHEISQALTAQERTAAQAAVLNLIAEFKTCATLAHQGKLKPNTVSPADCLRKDPDPILSAELVRESIRAKTQDAWLSEAQNFMVHVEGDYSDSALEALRVPHDFQDMPLIILTGEAGQERLAGYSSAGQSMAVSNPGQYIQLDQPQLVIDAVHSAVDQARRRHGAVKAK